MVTALPLAAAIGCVILLLNPVDPAERYASYVETTGEVMSSRVWEGYRLQGRRPLRYTEYYYVPSVEYRYLVDRVNYQSHTLAEESIEFKTRDEAEQFVAELRESEPFPVYYDPGAPLDSAVVLKASPSAERNPVATAVMGVAFAAFAVLIPVLAIAGQFPSLVK